MNQLIAPLLAMAGIILGAATQHYFSRKKEKQEATEKLIVDSYVDFIKGIAGMAMAQRFNDQEEHLQSSKLMLDAKTRIAIYGDPEIAQKVGEFFAKHGDLSKKEDRDALINLIHLMRVHSGSRLADTDRQAISQILFS